MEELERYHTDKMDALTKAKDWAGLVRHFVAHGGHQPAMDRAIGVLEETLRADPAKAAVETKILGLLTQWKDLQVWSKIGQSLGDVMDVQDRKSLVVLHGFVFALVAEDLPQQMGTKEAAERLIGVLEVVKEGYGLARAEGWEAEGAILEGVMASGLSASGRPEEALAPAEESVKILRELAKEKPPAFLPDLAGSLNTLANSLSELGRREEALKPAEEAMKTLRELAEKNPQAFLPALATSLNNLAIHYSELGRREEALKPSEEAVKIRRELAEKNPQFLPALAGSLNNLGNCFRDLGRRPDALKPAEESVKIYGDLAEKNPQAFLPDLAMCLHNLAASLGGLGRREEALKPAEEAAKIYRGLAKKNPQAFLPDLALSLNNLSTFLSELGRRKEALAPAEEAVKIYEKLAEENPPAFLPGLAMSLNNLANRLRELGRREEALDPAEESVKLGRELVGENPQVFLPVLAASLSNLANCFGDLGRREEALRTAEEAAKICGELAKKNPQVHLADLQTCLSTLATGLSGLGRWEEALKPAEEAVKICRVLVEENPQTFLPALAMCLHNLGITLRELGQREVALKSGEEAVSIHRKLSEMNPRAFLPDLAMCLPNLGITLSSLGRREEALQSAEAAVKIHRVLAKQNPQAFLPALAGSLNTLAISLSELGRREEALKPAEQAVKIRRVLAERNPQAFLPDLAISMNNLSIFFSELGRREEALKPAEEAVKIRRVSAEKNPQAFLPDLASSLNNVANHYSELGRPGEALAPAEEAMKIRRVLADKNPQAFLPHLARSLSTLAYLLSRLDRRKEALGKYLQAEEAFAKYDELEAAAPGGFIETRLGFYINLGTLLLEEDVNLGLPDYRQAYEKLKVALECVETFRGQFDNEDQRRRILNDYRQVYSLLVRTSIDLWDTEPEAAEAERLGWLYSALHAAEAGRQRSLLDQLQEEVLPDVEESLQAEYVHWRTELARAERQLNNELGSSGRSGVIEGTRSSMITSPTVAPLPEVILPKINESWRQAHAQYTRVVARIQELQPSFDPNRVVALVKPEELVEIGRKRGIQVEYFLGQDYGRALIVARGRIIPVRLESLSSVRAAEQWLKFNEGYRSQAGHGQWMEGLGENLKEIAEAIVWPVLRRLEEEKLMPRGSKTPLLLCAHEFLNGLPLHACPLDKEGTQVLADRFEVQYAPSLSVWVHAGSRKPDGMGSALCAGDPTQNLLFAGIQTELADQQLRQQGKRVETFRGKEATAEVVLGAAKEASWMYLAGHMYSDFNNPLNSALVLAPKKGKEVVPHPKTTEPVTKREERIKGSKEVEAAQPDESYLRLRQIYKEVRLRKYPEVYLDGCESGRFAPVQKAKEFQSAKEKGTGEEKSAWDPLLTDFDGLAMGFLFAGARSVIGTFWVVDDLSCALIMDRYLREREKEGSTAAQALQAATKWIRCGIRNESDLRKAVEGLLDRLPEEFLKARPKLREGCERIVAKLIQAKPEYPLSSPFYWAAHHLVGWSGKPIGNPPKQE